jgi:pSer/pThr/pTyr-binding forkhead associated (FHA) protein
MLFLCGELMDPMSAPRDTNLLRLAWDDPGTGEEFEWYGPTPVRLGRAPENEIVLNAAAVSRQHARIERDGGTLIVVDNGSGNGTFVGEQRVTRQTLADGSLLTIGPFTLTVDLDPPALGGIDAARQAARGGLRLRWASGDGIARELPLDRAVIIGRGDDCDIVLPTTSASRRHARIAPAGTGATITDQNSSNGTFVNDKRITERALAPGDVITIGGVSLTVEGNAPRASAEQEMATRIGVAAPVVAPAEGSTVLLDMPAALASARPANAFPPAIFDAQVVPIAALGATGLPIDETVYLAIGWRISPTAAISASAPNRRSRRTSACVPTRTPARTTSGAGRDTPSARPFPRWRRGNSATLCNAPGRSSTSPHFRTRTRHAPGMSSARSIARRPGSGGSASGATGGCARSARPTMAAT